MKLRMIKRQERPGAALWNKACSMNIAGGKEHGGDLEAERLAASKAEKWTKTFLNIQS